MNTDTDTLKPTCAVCAAAQLKLHFGHVRQVYQAPEELARGASSARHAVDATASVVDWVLTMYRATHHRELARLTAAHRLLTEVAAELAEIAAAEPDENANREAAFLAQEMRDKLPGFEMPTWEQVTEQRPGAEMADQVAEQVLATVTEKLGADLATFNAVRKSVFFAREHFRSKANADDVADELDHSLDVLDDILVALESSEQRAQKLEIHTVELECGCDKCRAKRAEQ
jgi:hypothetical protein